MSELTNYSMKPKAKRPRSWLVEITVLITVWIAVMVWWSSHKTTPVTSPPVAEKTNSSVRAVQETPLVAGVDFPAETNAVETETAETNTNNVPEGYKRVRFSVVGTDFSVKPQTNNLNQVNK